MDVVDFVNKGQQPYNTLYTLKYILNALQNTLQPFLPRLSSLTHRQCSIFS